MPLGQQLTRLYVPPGHGIRGSGDDLKSYFYQFKNAENSIKRSAFGRPFDGSVCGKFGGVAGTSYLLCLNVVAMGDINAADIGQAVHEAALEAFGCCSDDTKLARGRALPPGPVFEGTYIDDHLVLAIVPNDILREPVGPDRDLIKQSHLAYDHFKLERAPEKGFGFSQALSGPAEPEAAQEFLAWGTHVSSRLKTAGAPLMKRAHLLVLTSLLLALPVINKDLMRRILALYIHPITHRRELFSVFHRSSKWCNSIDATSTARIPPDIRDELMSASVLLGVAQGHLDWPICSEVSCTDATPMRGGSVRTRASQKLSRAMYRVTEIRGCYACLD